MQNQIENRLQRQHGVVAVWQLVRDGHSKGAIRHAVRGMRQVHRGVFVTGHAPLTDLQRWRAATSTAPGTVLSHQSCGQFAGFFGTDRGRTPITVTRRGSSGIERSNALTVRYSARMEPDVHVHDGMLAMSNPRTVLDLAGVLPSRTVDRMVRDALRLNAVTAVDLRVVLARHRGRRGTAMLRALVDEYGPLPLSRTKSDAEALAVALLSAAGLPDPLVNVHHEGEEADLSWIERRLIIELDGPHFHQFPTRDARKQAAWERAGWTVRRLPTDDVYDYPERLFAAVEQPTPADRWLQRPAQAAAQPNRQSL